MEKIKSNYTYYLNGIKINEKIISQDIKWNNEYKASRSGHHKGDDYKNNKTFNDNTSIKYIVIHNCSRIYNIKDQAMYYTKELYNENMSTIRVHLYIDDTEAWQTLKLGLGNTPNDSRNIIDKGTHTGSYLGDEKSIAIELPMDGWDGEFNQKVINNAVKVIAYLIKFYNLDINSVKSHTYFINKENNITGDEYKLNTRVFSSSRKSCPVYILPHWKEFISLIEYELNNIKTLSTIVVPIYKAESLEFKIGDIIEFIGDKGYTSSNAKTGNLLDKGDYTVTNIYKTGNHPYFIKNDTGLGWVDITDIRGK